MQGLKNVSISVLNVSVSDGKVLFSSLCWNINKTHTRLLFYVHLICMFCYLHRRLPGITAFKSDASTTFKAGPMYYIGINFGECLYSVNGPAGSPRYSYACFEWKTDFVM